MWITFVSAAMLQFERIEFVPLRVFIVNIHTAGIYMRLLILEKVSHAIRILTLIVTKYVSIYFNKRIAMLFMTIN